VLKVKAPQEVMRYIVEKGSVAIDGISLTVASCEKSAFTIAVIPHTLSSTALSFKKPGDQVNLEADIIGKICGEVPRRPGAIVRGDGRSPP